MRKFFNFLFLFLLIFSCSKENLYKNEDTKFVMGTYLRIVVYGDNKDDLKVKIDSSFILAQKLDKKFSVFDGSIALINKEGKGLIDHDFKLLINHSYEVYKITKGDFDITVFPLIKLWGFADNEPHLPDSTSIRDVLKKVDMKKVVIKGDSIFLNYTEIDLSSIAKGYIVDKVVEYLRNNGITTGLVDAGGDIRVWGSRRKKSFYKIGLKNPRGKGLIDTLRLKDISVATSGDYENYFLENGKRYCHLINANTGYPVDRFVSVTVFNEKAYIADMWATALFVSGEKAFEIVKRSNIRAIFVYKDAKSLKLVEYDRGKILREKRL